MSKSVHPRVNSIALEGIGKNYTGKWIFKDINIRLNHPTAFCITGPNGSGKSTLLKIIAGYVTPTKGHVKYYCDEVAVADDQYFRHISFAAPYLELIEDFTIEENIRFFVRNKPLLNGFDETSVMQEAGLTGAGGKLVKAFSSGMKQRLKLALAFLADTEILFLDEPLSNLDASGHEWYKSLAARFSANRTLIVGSNHVAAEAFFCKEQLALG